MVANFFLERRHIFRTINISLLFFLIKIWWRRLFLIDEVCSIWSILLCCRMYILYYILANISAVVLFNAFSFCWIADELLASRRGFWSIDLSMFTCFWRHTRRHWCELRVSQVATLSVLWPTLQGGFILFFVFISRSIRGLCETSASIAWTHNVTLF